MIEEANAQELALAATGNVLVNAGPGTGKTHLIASKAERLVASGVEARRVLVLTFSRRAAAELKSRLASVGAQGCEVRTFHGFASRLLEAGGQRFKTRRLLGAYAEALVFERALARTPLETFNEETRRSKRFRNDAFRFASDLRRNERAAVERLRGVATPRVRDLIDIADAAVDAREKLRASDLNDLIGRAVDALDDPTSPQCRWLEKRYTQLLIDEFQDIDRVQLSLCERIGGTVFAVGDPAQSIYRFRGAVHGIFGEGEARLGLQRFTLRESRRCPQIVCDLAAATPQIDAVPLRSLAGREGSIELLKARTTLDEAALIADRVEDALAGGVAPENIAVLIRAMRPVGTAVARELASRRIAVATSGSEAFFADVNVAVVRLALRAIARPSDHDRWIAFLSAPFLGFDVTALRIQLASVQFTSVDSAIAWLDACNLPGALDASRLCIALRSAAASVANDDLGDAARTLVRELMLLERLTKLADVGRARESIARLSRFMDALGEAQRSLTALREPAGAADLIESIDEYIDEIGNDETPADDTTGVRVLTIHGSKGLQFDVVIIGDAVDGRIPAAPRASTLLSDLDRAALMQSGVECVDAREDDGSIEEASLWYVAVTRSRDALVITYAEQGGDGSPQRISRFVPPELHLPEGSAAFERTHGRFEVILAKSQDAVARDVFEQLAKEFPIVDAMRRHGVAAFEPVDGRPVVIARDLSVSAAGTWMKCPRRFYYEYALGLKSEASVATVSGTAMHLVFSRFHTEYRTFGAADGSRVAEWRARLRALRAEVWADVDFGSEVYRAATAAVADRQLDRYAEALAMEAALRPFEVVATERAISVAFAEGALRGKIDRIDRLEDGTLVLRDYKSGRKKGKAFGVALREAFAEGVAVPGEIGSDLNPQLALYRSGAEAAYGASVSSIEFVYLKGEDKTPATIARDITPIDGANRGLFEALDRFTADEFVAALKRGAETPKTTDANACKYCEFMRRRLCEGVEQ